MTIDLGTDLWCTDDLTETMKEVSGLLCVAQAVFRRLTTPRGALLDEPDYGLDVRRFLHRALTRAERESIPGQIRQEILKDPRIATVDVEILTLTADEFTLDIRCTTAAGPFELVTSVSTARGILASATIEGVLHTLAEEAEAVAAEVPAAVAEFVEDDEPEVPLLEQLLAAGTCELLLLPQAPFTEITTAAGPVVTAFADMSGAGHNFAHATVGEQPDFVEVDANVNGQPSIYYDGNDRLVSTSAKSTWRFLHDGTGCTFMLVYRSDASTAVRVLLSSQRASASRVGTDLYLSGADQIWLAVSNGGGAMIVNEFVDGVSPDETPNIVTVRLGSGEASEFDIRVNGTSVASGAFAGAPSAADPFGDLTVGNYTLGATTGAIGSLPLVAAYSDYIVLAAVQSLEAAVAAHYGITLP